MAGRVRSRDPRWARCRPLHRHACASPLTIRVPCPRPRGHVCRSRGHVFQSRHAWQSPAAAMEPASPVAQDGGLSRAGQSACRVPFPAAAASSTASIDNRPTPADAPSLGSSARRARRFVSDLPPNERQAAGIWHGSSPLGVGAVHLPPNRPVDPHRAHSLLRAASDRQASVGRHAPPPTATPRRPIAAKRSAR